MGLHEPQSVDAIGIESSSDLVVLSILDSWDWSDHLAHLQALTDKINGYLAFVEADEIVESYPLARGRNVVIEIVSRYPVPDSAANFFSNAAACVAQYGVHLRTKYSPDGE